MQRHLDAPALPLDDHAPGTDLEPAPLHRLDKGPRVLAARVGEDRLAARIQQPGHEPRQRRGVALLVEHVRRDHEIEAPERRRRRMPVEQGGREVSARVDPRVVGGEVEGGPVVVGREDAGAAVERNDGGQTYAAAELDRAAAREVAGREVAGEGYGARPEIRPVGQALVARELRFIYERVGLGGVQQAVGLAADLDGGLGDGGAAAEVGLQWPGAGQRPAVAASREARFSRSASASWAML